MGQANQHLNIINKLFDEVYTNGNINVLEQLCTNDVKLIDPAAANFKKGIQGLKDFEMSYKMAFPTKTCRIDHSWVAEDSVIVHWTVTAIHKGTFQDIPATGKSIKISGISIHKFSNNKICEISQSWDRLGLYEQLGLSFHAKTSW
jgi:steroid delta-isomerase-like uncharacterized protein